MDLEPTLADLLFLARVETGATVAELAGLVGVSPGTIEGFEAGAIRPTADVLVGLAGVLAVDVGDLLVAWDHRPAV